MKPDSTSYENILEVENQGSQLSTFYKIMSPVQITLESCTGLGETDQYSIQMFSPNGCWLHENSMDALFRALSSRPLHRHDYFELMLVLEGEVIQQIEEKEYPYRAGISCLVNRSILHNERFIGPAKLCFIGLSVDFVRSLTENASLQLFEAERHLPENPVLQFMLANLGQDLRKEYQDLFPTPPKLTLAKPISFPCGSIGRIDTVIGTTASCKTASVRIFTASSMLTPLTSASSAMGASNSQRRSSAAICSGVSNTSSFLLR